MSDVRCLLGWHDWVGTRSVLHRCYLVFCTRCRRERRWPEYLAELEAKYAGRGHHIRVSIVPDPYWPWPWVNGYGPKTMGETFEEIDQQIWNLDPVFAVSLGIWRDPPPDRCAKVH